MLPGFQLRNSNESYHFISLKVFLDYHWNTVLSPISLLPLGSLTKNSYWFCSEIFFFSWEDDFCSDLGTFWSFIKETGWGACCCCDLCNPPSRAVLFTPSIPAEEGIGGHWREWPKALLKKHEHIFPWKQRHQQPTAVWSSLSFICH